MFCMPQDNCVCGHITICARQNFDSAARIQHVSVDINDEMKTECVIYLRDWNFEMQSLREGVKSSNHFRLVFLYR